MATNNNETYLTLREASAQFIGDSEVDTLTLTNIVDDGSTWDFSKKEQWAKTLTAMYVKDIYTDADYTDSENDIFYEDSAEFGAISRIISVELPEVIESRNWIDVTSGVTTIGENVVYLPIVKEQLFGTSASWSIPIAFTGTQLNSAFKSVEGLREFDSYVRLVAKNSVTLHKKVMATLNRNNYIAEKINVGNSSGKINVVNLIQDYCVEHGVNSMTVEQWRNSPNAMKHAVKVLKKYKNMLTDMSTIFTTDITSHGKFVPNSRLVFQVLADFESDMEISVESEIYHNEFVKMPMHRTVNAWQGLTGDETSIDFSTLSTIDVTTAGGNTVTKSGIVGFMCDKWAIMHTIVQSRVGVQRDDIKDITLNDFQFTDRYLNNLTLPGVVFVLEDYTAEVTA